jgi:hypothetical protein
MKETSVCMNVRFRFVLETVTQGFIKPSGSVSMFATLRSRFDHRSLWISKDGFILRHVALNVNLRTEDFQMSQSIEVPVDLRILKMLFLYAMPLS